MVIFLNKDLFQTGWWWLNHLEKYNSQWEGLSHIWNETFETTKQKRCDSWGRKGLQLSKDSEVSWISRGWMTIGEMMIPALLRRNRAPDRWLIHLSHYFCSVFTCPRCRSSQPSTVCQGEHSEIIAGCSRNSAILECSFTWYLDVASEESYVVPTCPHHSFSNMAVSCAWDVHPKYVNMWISENWTHQKPPKFVMCVKHGQTMS